MPVSSGAAARTASSIVRLTVTVDEAHPWQLPDSRSRATPVRVDAEEGTYTSGVRAEIGPHPVQRRFDAFIHGQRV